MDHLLLHADVFSLIINLLAVDDLSKIFCINKSVYLFMVEYYYRYRIRANKKFK